MIGGALKQAGTAAFGACVIAIVKTIRAIIAYVRPSFVLFIRETRARRRRRRGARVYSASRASGHRLDAPHRISF
jgi:hypothetical protein